MSRPRSSPVTITHADGTVSTSSAYTKYALRKIKDPTAEFHQCTAITRAGTRCGHPAITGRNLCGIHDPRPRKRRGRWVPGRLT